MAATDAGVVRDSGGGDAGAPTDAGVPTDAPVADAFVPDAGTPTDAGPGDAGGPADGGPACTPPVTTAEAGRHNPGRDCISCHDGTGGAPLWTAAGTIYTTVDGTTPLAGATIFITDADGDTIELVSALNGNFWTATPLTYPLEASASRCPDSAVMVSDVPSPGSCNSCHGAGDRIALPAP